MLIPILQKRKLRHREVRTFAQVIQLMSRGAGIQIQVSPAPNPLHVNIVVPHSRGKNIVLHFKLDLASDPSTVQRN